MTKRYIFNNADIHSEIESREESLKKTIQQLDSNYILNVSEEDLVQSLVKEFRMDVPIILDKKIHVADLRETQVDVSKYPRRIKPIGHRGRPYYVTGTTVTIAVPFEGDPELLTMRPSRLSSPIPDADIVDSEIHLEYVQVEEDGGEVQRKYSAAVTRIKEHLEMLRGTANGYNVRLERRSSIPE